VERLSHVLEGEPTRGHRMRSARRTRHPRPLVMDAPGGRTSSSPA
jgi:hypothetical protein